MPDDPDPPRKIYGFKAKEFERANPARPEAPADVSAPAPESNPEQKIDVHELIRAGAGAGKQLGSNKVANRDNQVHGMLRENFQHDVAAGHYDLGTLDDSKRRRRIRNYWLLMVAINVPFGGIAWAAGHTNPLPFVCSLSVAVLLSVRLTWQTFFLRTHY